jgi:hypothetical protein
MFYNLSTMGVFDHEADAFRDAETDFRLTQADIDGARQLDMSGLPDADTLVEQGGAAAQDAVDALADALAQADPPRDPEPTERPGRSAKTPEYIRAVAARLEELHAAGVNTLRKLFAAKGQTTIALPPETHDEIDNLLSVLHRKVAASVFATRADLKELLREESFAGDDPLLLEEYVVEQIETTFGTEIQEGIGIVWQS